jgi:hypothetical protein
VGEFEHAGSFLTVLGSPVLDHFLDHYKNFWVGVTNSRLIFIPLVAFTKPMVEDCFSIPLTEIEFKAMLLTVKLPDNPKPKKLNPNFGFKYNTGFDEKEFTAALKSVLSDQKPTLKD